MPAKGRIARRTTPKQQDVGEDFRTEAGRKELAKLLPRGWKLKVDLRERPGKGRGGWQAWNGEYGADAVNFHSVQFQKVMCLAWMYHLELIDSEGNRLA
jgi:hypothetical protein